jgi:hypothetical protein
MYIAQVKDFYSNNVYTIFMTCYFRHLAQVFQKAGLVVDVDNRKRVDIIIHEMAGIEYKDCTKIMAALDEKFETEDAFVQRLRAECLARNIYLEY